MQEEKDAKESTWLSSIEGKTVSRREFLQYAGLAGVVVVGGGLGGFVAACGGGTSSTAASGSAGAGQGEPYRLGMVSDLTGALAAAGADVRDGVLVLIDKYNAAGGCKGPDGKMHKWELLVEDGGVDAGRATAAFNKLIMNDKVTGVMGPLWSNEVPSAQAIVERNQLPGLLSSTPQPATMDKGYKWSFMMGPAPSLKAQGAVAIMLVEGFKSVVAIADNEGVMQGGMRLVPDYLPKDGNIKYTIIDDTFTVGDVNLNSQALKVKAKADEVGADAIFLVTDGISAIPLIKTYHKLGGSLPFIGNTAWSNDAIIKAGGADYEGALVPGNASLAPDQLPDTFPLKAISTQFATEFKAKYNRPPSSFAANTYTSMMMWQEAFGAVGPDKQKLLDYLDSMTDFVGPSGIYNWKETHNGQSVEDEVIFQIKDGSWLALAYIDKDGKPVKV